MTFTENHPHLGGTSSNENAQQKGRTDRFSYNCQQLTPLMHQVIYVALIVVL